MGGSRRKWRRLIARGGAGTSAALAVLRGAHEGLSVACARVAKATRCAATRDCLTGGESAFVAGRRVSPTPKSNESLLNIEIKFCQQKENILHTTLGYQTPPPPPPGQAHNFGQRGQLPPHQPCLTVSRASLATCQVHKYLGSGPKSRECSG